MRSYGSFCKVEFFFVTHPPPKVGAFINRDPLKAVCSNDYLTTVGGQPSVNSVSWSNRLSSCSCLRIYSRIDSSSAPTVDT